MYNSRFKFRAWDKTKKIMYPTTSMWDDPYIRFDGQVIHYRFSAMGGEGRTEDKTREWEVLQCTGLKDKHGTEIYEGDILNVCNGSINGMPWMDKPYAVYYRLNKGWNMCMFCWDKEGNSQMNSTHWCEVIGNIYENPNILKTCENNEQGN